MRIPPRATLGIIAREVKGLEICYILENFIHIKKKMITSYLFGTLILMYLSRAMANRDKIDAFVIMIITQQINRQA